MGRWNSKYENNVGCCHFILTNGSKECYYSLELGLKVSILGKKDKYAGWKELRVGHHVLDHFG